MNRATSTTKRRRKRKHPHGALKLILTAVKESQKFMVEDHNEARVWRMAAEAVGLKVQERQLYETVSYNVTVTRHSFIKKGIEITVRK